MPVQPSKKAEPKVLLTWKAPARPFKRRNREYYTTVGAIVFLLAVILLFMQEWLLIAVMIAMAFLAYVLAAVPPDEVDHALTTRGVWTGDHLYPWERFESFWFSEKWGQGFVTFEPKEGTPGQLMLLLGSQDKGALRKILSSYVEEQQPTPAWGDKAAKWLSDKIPLEE